MAKSRKPTTPDPSGTGDSDAQEQKGYAQKAFKAAMEWEKRMFDDPATVGKINDWVAKNGNGGITKALQLEALTAAAMENKGLDVFNMEMLTGGEDPAAPDEKPEPVYSVETAEPFRIMPPLRYRSRSFLRL